MNTEFDVKHPILLDAPLSLVRLLARSLHYEYFQQSLDYMRSVLDVKYVFLGFCRLLRSIENLCVTCRNRKASTNQPIMADLPVERIEYKQPFFNHTGVDCFGSLYIPVRRSTEKAWGFVFTCLNTWAVHLKIVPYLDTSSFVRASKGSLRVEVQQARSGRMAERNLMVRKRNYLPVSRTASLYNFV